MSMTEQGHQIEVFARLSASLEGATDEMRKARRPPPQPIYEFSTRSGLFPSSGVLALNLGGPRPGYRYSLKAARVGGATPTTTAAGRADLYVADSGGSILGGGPNNASGVVAGALSNWVDQATPLPLVAFYSPAQVFLHPGEVLWVVFSSGTAAQLYIANASFEVTTMSDYRSENIV